VGRPVGGWLEGQGDDPIALIGTDRLAPQWTYGLDVDPTSGRI
jgi:hypothetical protein